MRKITWLLLGLFLCSGSSTFAQDTTVVQCFDFNDITKRRGKYKFPDANESFSKILMVYTLKCDPRTTRDRYDCGEWDYLTYTKLYHHDGTIDSTYRTHPTFRVVNQAPETFSYTTKPTFDLLLDKQYSIKHTGVQSMVRDTIDGTKVGTNNVLNTGENSGRSQFIWRASELTAAGMTAGSISGLQLDVKKLGSDLNNFEIRMGHTQKTNLNDGFVDGLTMVHRHKVSFTSTGYNDVQFVENFSWNGADNIVVEFLFDNKLKGNATELNGNTTAYNSGFYAASTDYFVDLNGNRQYINLGNGAQVLGNRQRTIELWARVDRFNNAGLFQAGKTGTNGADFSLRTRGNDEQWRMQQWGPADFDFTTTGTKEEWHHYAVTKGPGGTTVLIDGVVVSSDGTSINTLANDIFLGRWSGSYLDGAINDFRIWDTTLTLQEINDWMHKKVDNTHPKFNKLKAYYPMNEGNGNSILDFSPQGQTDGVLNNHPVWKRTYAEDLYLGFEQTTIRPNIIFEKGVYTTSVKDSVFVTDTLFRSPTILYKYNNPAGGKKIDDDAVNHPTKATDTMVVYTANEPWYTYDRKTGNVLYTRNIPSEVTLKQGVKEWYSPEVTFELARFITPYGIRLDLGADGFSWFYDVTDYRHLLADSVDISAGNQQELIDLKFLMIKGKPARPVVRMDRVWGTYRSYRYRDLSSDAVLSAKKIKQHSDAEYMMLKTRLTGHGHNSDDGSYPHCCEWKDNTHYLRAHGSEVANWHIWQTHDCALNPVYPQGGTWPGAREGWCPGDVVKETDIDLTQFMNGDSMEVDYDITKVPTNNQGMGNGSYVVAMHLFQYGAANYTVDAEIYDVINPTSKRIHERRGNVCQDPAIIIRNGGSENLTSLIIRYRVRGGKVHEYKWKGNLGFMETEQVTLPIKAESFFTGDGSNAFEVKIGHPNGKNDENTANDNYVTQFKLPVMYPPNIVMQLNTNNQAVDNSLTIKDVNGNVVFTKGNLTNNTIYNDTLKLDDGCYTLEMIDENNDGLSYWANSGQGSGQLLFKIYNSQGIQVGVKPFLPDFGRKINYSFSVGQELGSYVDNMPDEEVIDWEFEQVGVSSYEFKWKTIKVTPNPTKDLLHIEMLGQEGAYQLDVVSVSGQTVLKSEVEVDTYQFKTLDVGSLPKGMYILKLTNGVDHYSSKFVKE